MIPWWVAVMTAAGGAFLGMILMALMAASGRGDPRD